MEPENLENIKARVIRWESSKIKIVEKKTETKNTNNETKKH